MSEDVIRRCDFKIREGRKYRAHGEQIPDNVPTVFSLGETAYKGDLCEAHQLLLAEVLAPFIDISQGYVEVNRSVRQLLHAGKGRASQSDMRAWAMENTDFDVHPTGALKKEVIEAFWKANA